jgi:sulfur carrier protein
LKEKLNRQPFVPDPGNAGVGKRTVRIYLISGRFCGFFYFTLIRRHILYGGEMKMEITVNGEQKIVESMSMVKLLESLDIDLRRVVVELNLEILPKAEYATTIVNEGDKIEIVHFVGGGQQR